MPAVFKGILKAICRQLETNSKFTITHRFSVCNQIAVGDLCYNLPSVLFFDFLIRSFSSSSKTYAPSVH